MAAITATAAVASLGWLVVCAACAQGRIDAASTGSHFAGDNLLLQARHPTAEEILFGARPVDVTASYRMSPGGDKLWFGYAGSPGAVALGPPVSSMRRYAGLDSPDGEFGGHWLYPDNNARVFTVGYVWRDLTIERSAFSDSSRDSRERHANRNELRLDSRSLRLSFNPSPAWTLQFSRGSLGGLDQLDRDNGVRRTSISATYRQVFTEGEWQTTFAWGRNSRKLRESTMGYLAESTLRFSRTHVVFGRLEQVGSDDLVRENELVKTDMFKMNKLTLGYFHDLDTGGQVKLDVGIFASRHFVPAAMTNAYGANPTAFMLFIRLKP